MSLTFSAAHPYPDLHHLEISANNAAKWKIISCYFSLTFRLVFGSHFPSARHILLLLLLLATGGVPRAFTARTRRSAGGACVDTRWLLDAKCHKWQWCFRWCFVNLWNPYPHFIHLSHAIGESVLFRRHLYNAATNKVLGSDINMHIWKAESVDYM